VVRFIESLITLEITGEIYNICNPKHPTRQVYYQSACRALGLTPPQFSNVQIKNPKVVSNSKSLTLNGFTYKWAIN
jgi:nucleoside-diphosphate-sugar epimerase